jgi:NTP pyrophosphatase (non-canonical NTP hydrolase)
MDIKEIEKRIMDFAKKRASAKNFDLTPELSYIHLTEELGEVARQLSNKKIRPDLFDEANLKEEIVDVILEAIILANICEADLDKEISQKIDALFSWGKPIAQVSL